MADPPHRVPELSPFGHRRDLWGARLAYSSGVPIIEMVAKANISRIAQTDLVYRQAIPVEMQRVLTIIAWLLVRCSLSSMPSAAVEQRRSEPFLDRTTVSAIDIILELEGAAQHRLAPLGHRRSEERRVGKEWVRTCRSRWSP